MIALPHQAHIRQRKIRRSLIFLLAAFSHILIIRAQKNTDFDHLYSSATKYKYLHKYDTAYILAKQALAAGEKYKNKDTIYCSLLELLTELCSAREQIKEGLPYGILLVEQAEIICGKKSARYASAMHDKAVLLKMSGKYAEADSAYLEALKVKKIIYGDQHKSYAYTLANIGALYKSEGRYPEAEKAYLQALKIQKSALPPDDDTYLFTLNRLALLYSDLKDARRAEKLFREVAEAKKRKFGKESLEYTSVISGLAKLYMEEDNYAKAEPLFKECMRVEEAANFTQNQKFSTLLNNFGTMYSKMGNFPEAVKLYKRSLRIIEEIMGKDNPDYATTMMNLGLIYYYMNEFSLSTLCIKESGELQKKMYGAKNLNYAKALSAISTTYKTAKNYLEAEKVLTEASEIYKETLGENTSLYANSLNNLASVYDDKGDDEVAAVYYEKAALIFEKIVGVNNQSSINSQLNLGITLAGLHKMKEAEPHYLKAVHGTLGLIYENFSFLSEKEKEFLLKMSSINFSKFFYYCSKYAGEKPEITIDLYNTLLAYKGLLLKSSQTMRRTVAASGDTSLVSLYNQWTKMQKEVIKLNSVEISKRKSDPELLQKKANELEKELVRRCSDFSSMEKLKSVTWNDIRRSLKPDEAAVEFCDYEGFGNKEKGYLALVIKQSSKYPVLVQLGVESDLSRILGAEKETNIDYIKRIYGSNSDPNKALYDLIWKPMENALGNAKKIYYSPSGTLHKISFAAMGFAKNNYISDKHDMCLLGSTAKIVYPDKIVLNSNSTACIFGDINFDTPFTSTNTSIFFKWPYLAGTKTESEKVDSILKHGGLKVNYYSGEKASEETFKKTSKQSNVIHIATHGFFFPEHEKENNQEQNETNSLGLLANGENAIGVHNFLLNKDPLLRSGLVFAGANEVWATSDEKEGEDGVLTAQEVALLDLSKVDLVVLSACETGLGDIKGSEGVYGLQRSLKMAGVKFIIMSLWQVPDAETVEFMEKFYTKLTLTKNLKTSFRDTQKEMRKKLDPFFWAPFVLIE